MHTSQQNPFVSRLTSAQRETLEMIRLRNTLRFGDDLFRMEDEGGEGGSGGEGGGSGGEGGSGGGEGEGGSGGSGGGDGTEKVELDKLPKDVQDLVKRYRKEAAEASGKARDDAKKKAAEDAQAALMQDIGKKLGFIKDEKDQMTPEEFAKKLADAGSETSAAKAVAKQKDIELAVYRSASKAGGDPDALLDSRSFLEKVAELDPSAKDFNDKVTAAIKDAVEKNPKLKPRAGAGSSSVDHGSGGTGDQGERKVKPLDQAVAGHYGV